MGNWPYPRVLAHRGGGTLAPENTLAALRCGLAHGYHAVEFDVMLAQDGVAVVLHDTELGRTVAGAGNAFALTSAQLAAMDAGAWFAPAFAGEPVPLFSPFAQFCKSNGIWMNIEIKPAPGFEAQTGTVVAHQTRALFAAEIATGDMAQVPLLSSFSVAALAGAREAAPELARGYLIDQLDVDWERQARAQDVVAIHTNARYLTAVLAGDVKRAGFALFCYTVNDPARAAELVAWGVDGFCTDRIDLIGADFA